MKKIILCVLLLGWVVTMPAQNQPSRQNAGDRYFPEIGRLLTDEQRASLQTALGPQLGQIQSLAKQMRASRQALLDEITSGKFDEATARQNAKASAEAEGELTVIYAKALSEIQPPLSAEQIRQIRSIQPRQLPRGTSTPPAAPEVHLPLPPSLPRDSNGLPIMN
ncbi:MAG: Spy/CpxP family protein refolding chaperone [Limisphaerales bacterium]